MEKHRSLKRKYPNHLSIRIVAFCVILIGILCTGITFISYQMYREDMIKRYQEYETTILNLALSGADAEGIEEAIKTGRKNKSYHALSKVFNSIMENSNVKYIYALYFQEKEEAMYYVLNGYTEEQTHIPGEVHGLGELPLEGDFRLAMIEELRYAFEEGKQEIGFITDTDSKNDYLQTAYYPLKNTDGKSVCIFCVDIAMTDIYQNLHDFIQTVMIGVAVLAAFLLSIFLLLMKKQLIEPIKMLADSAKSFIRQQEKTAPEQLVFKKVPIHTRDEMELLSDSLNYMVCQLKEYMVNLTEFAAEKERVNAQFAIVQQLKENLFPFQFPAFQDRTDFEVHAKIRYSKENSGDFYNFFLIDTAHLCFFLGTASGKGVTTTMVAMIATIYMENYARLGYLPNRILGETNNRLSENNHGEITVNTFLGILDLETGEFTYAQVGETVPFVKRAGKTLEVLECPSGFALGSMENVVYPQRMIQLTQGESVVLCTQGIAKKLDKKGYEFTEDAVRQTVDETMQEEYALEKMIEKVEDVLDAFGEGTVQEMDETLMVVRFIGQ